MLKHAQPPTDTKSGLGPRFITVGLGVCILALSACGPQPTPLPPPEPNPFTGAEAAFGAGDYASAANGYRRSLIVEDPRIEVNREQALFRLALIHALPDSPLEDMDQARTFLDELVTKFPDTSHEVEIRSLLALQSTIAASSSTIETLRSTMDRLETNLDQQTDTIGQLNDQLEQLEQRLEETETELEKLKEIDLGRRPRE